jgi:hypothetical protein
MRRAVKLITENRETLDRLAHALLRTEVLEREAIQRIVHGGPIDVEVPPGEVLVAAAESTDVRPIS